MLDFGKLLDPIALGAGFGGIAAALTGLAVIEKEVDDVAKGIKAEIDILENNRFDVDGYIATGSFGQGAEARVLAQEHTRAHSVIVGSLKEAVTDLETFKEAIQQAKRLLKQSDEDAEVRLRTVLAKAESLDLGWHGQDPAPAPAPAGSTNGNGEYV